LRFAILSLATVVLLNDLGASFLESQHRKPDPGFVIDGPWVGRPRFYISHGKHDPILPIEKCGRRIAADLNAHAYGVTLKEFDGGHEIPADVLREGFRWLGSL
jgi:phospholipase/carboxylesterase